MEIQELLRSAMWAARSGQRQSARALFLQAAEQDPDCELAWLWLSELHDEPGERIAALECALRIRPSNLSAQTRLAQLRAGLPEDAGTAAEPAAVPLFFPDEQLPISAAAPLTLDDDQANAAGEMQASAAQPANLEQDACQQAQRLAKEGKIDSALSLLYQLVEAYPQRADAWLLIAQITPRSQEKIKALEKVAEIYPRNQKVRSRIERLETLENNPFLVGQQHEERGEREQALLVYEWIKVHSRSPADRLEAARRMDNLHIIDEAERLQPVSPTLSLLRLTFGPLVLFTLLIFIQSGLNPLKIPLIALLGEVCVLAGSLLVNVTSLRPMHPRWIKAFGLPGTPAELEMRFDLRLLGWALLAAPFILFFIDALHRLLLFRAAMEY
jgi:tetratricopeptide (TPR) repeat protein